MLIVYTQAGSEMAGSMGLTSFGGHASIAVLDPDKPKYISWVTRPGMGGIKYELDHFSKGAWSGPVYRIQIPTAEDGASSHMSTRKALHYWNNDLIAEAQAHEAKWNLNPPNPTDDRRSSLKAEFNCAEIVRKILIGAGALAYNHGNVPFKSAGTPDTVARLASYIHRRVGDSIAQLEGQWPAEPDLKNFFAQDTLRGKNVVPWPKHPHTLAPK